MNKLSLLFNKPKGRFCEDVVCRRIELATSFLEAVTSNFLTNLLIDDDAGALLLVLPALRRRLLVTSSQSTLPPQPTPLDPQLVEFGQESVVCSHALRGGDWVWLA